MSYLGDIEDLGTALHCASKIGCYYNLDPMDYEESLRSLVFELNLMVSSILNQYDEDIRLS